MFKLIHNCTYLICQQSNAQNSPSQVSTVREQRMFKLGLENAEEPEINCQYLLDHQKGEFQKKKKIYFCFIDYAESLTVWITTNRKILKETGIPDYLTCLLRNLYAGQETTVRTGHGKSNWFQIGKGVCQGCILSLCLFNFYAENIIWNAGLDEAQAGIKIAGRNINNLRYTNDTTPMAESEEELKSLLMKVKEESKNVGLKRNIQKMRSMASGPITSWRLDGETIETVTVWFFGGVPKSLKMVTEAMKLKDACSLEEKPWPT